MLLYSQHGLYLNLFTGWIGPTVHELCLYGSELWTKKLYYKACSPASVYMIRENRNHTRRIWNMYRSSTIESIVLWQFTWKYQCSPQTIAWNHYTNEPQEELYIHETLNATVSFHTMSSLFSGYHMANAQCRMLGSLPLVLLVRPWFDASWTLPGTLHSSISNSTMPSSQETVIILTSFCIPGLQETCYLDNRNAICKHHRIFQICPSCKT